MPVKKIFIYFSKKGLDFLWQVSKKVSSFYKKELINKIFFKTKNNKFALPKRLTYQVINDKLKKGFVYSK